MLSLLSALRVTILHTKQQVIFTESNKKGVKKLYNFTESKKGGDETIPLDFNLPSLS
jgi:hypothetical protein